jgi:Mg-chelatase subunit ChlD
MKRFISIYEIIAILIIIAILPLHSVTYKLPLISISPKPEDFDTTSCNTKKCKTINFSNVSDTLITVYKIDSLLSSPFSLESSVTVPFNIAPGANKTVSFCYNPLTAPKSDSDIVYLRANVRLPVSVGLIFGVDSNMSLKLSPTDTLRIAACNAAGNSFVNDLLDTLTIKDEAGVFTYQNAASYAKTADFSSIKSSIKSGIPTTSTSGGSYVYDAIMKAINTEMVNRLNKRILIVFVDSPNLDATTTAAVISLANADRVTIYIIGMGEAAMTPLSGIASGTGGKSYYVASSAAMLAAIQDIEISLSNNSIIPFTLKGKAVAPAVQLDPTGTVDFGIVPIGIKRCLQLKINNTGNGDLVVSSIDIPSLPFSFDPIPSFPLAPIPAGGQTIINICFLPVELGDKSLTINLTYNGCNSTSSSFIIKGRGDNAPLGPILRIESTDLDTTFCVNKKCKDITFRNLGDSVLTLYNIDSLMTAPFAYSGSISLPASILPNGAINFSLCYSPTIAPHTDQETVYLRADSRVSLSVGLLFDVSGSMGGGISTSDHTVRLAAAKAAGISFVNGLLNTAEIKDEDAVYSFSASFAIDQPFTNDKNLLVQKIQGLTLGTSTALYNSLVSAINNVSSRANKKTIIVLTDGGDNAGGNTPQSVINAANAAGVTIFTIAIGEADVTALTQIANGTGGRFFSANNAPDLIAVYRQIATLLSKNISISYIVKGRSVAPNLVLSKTNLTYDSTKVGQNVCQDVFVKNIGDAPGAITGINHPSNQYLITSIPTAPIAPGDSAGINICFKPTLIRVLNDNMSILLNSCNQSQLNLSATGIAWDSVTVMILDTIFGSPDYDFGNGGDAAFSPQFKYQFPIRLLGKIPYEYRVDSMNITFTYNKTVIWPDDANFHINAFKQFSIARTYDNTLNGYYTGHFSDGPLQNYLADTTMMQFPFIGLLGNSLQTPVNISKVVLADGNPKVGIITKGLFIEDSSCYFNLRLINASDRWKAAALLAVFPNPAEKLTTIKYLINEPGWTKMELLNINGDVIFNILEGEKNKGNYEAVLDVGSITNGSYLIRLKKDNFSDVQQFIISK